MDPGFLIGIVIAFGALVAMIVIEGASVSSLLLPGPMLLVFGATIAVGVAGATLRDAVFAMRALPRAIRGRTQAPQEIIDRVVTLAERARKDGLLALEQEAQDIDDPFLRRALQGIADGMDADDLRDAMEDELDTRDRSNRAAAKFFTSMGGYAPTIGIIGTVVSLTHVLENLDAPETLGHSIAAAFVATLWGLLSANFIWLPIGSRLNRLAEIENERMMLLMEGVMAVQAGSQPRLLGERLRAMALPDELPDAA